MSQDQEKPGVGTPGKESIPPKERASSIPAIAGTGFDNLQAPQQAAQGCRHATTGNPAIAAPAAPQPERWAHIPAALRDRPQWCIAAPDKSPYTVTGHRASVTEPAHWCDFASAAMVAEAGNAGIGFVLSEGDGLTCIDLDVKDDTPQEQLDRYWQIVQAFDSYTEFSRSGRGLHIWVKGHIGAGCRRDGVEVYSQERFIICTGNPLQGYDKPVEERQELLDTLVEEIRNAQATATVQLIEVAETDTDEAIWQRGADADNGDKFRQLWGGKWSEMGYPSQSEADFALLSMLAFYSKSNEQVRRLFRMSALGKRDKAQKNDRYIDRSLSHIRGRQERENERVASAELLSAELVKKLQATGATQASQLGNPLDLRAKAAPADAVQPADGEVQL